MSLKMVKRRARWCLQNITYGSVVIAVIMDAGTVLISLMAKYSKINKCHYLQKVANYSNLIK